MIRVIAPGSSETAQRLVMSALGRSCGQGAVTGASFGDLMRGDHSGIWVIIDPLESWSHYIGLMLGNSVKILLLGRLPEALAACLGASVAPLDPSVRDAVSCDAAPPHASASSTARIVYTATVVARISGRGPVIPERACRRYDFAREWNNLGWGAINADGDEWSLSQHLETRAECTLASLEVPKGNGGAYAALWTNASASVLWFNRPCGPIDSPEWRHVEDFVSCHRHGLQTCVPVLSEIPHGYTAAATMRLDCDEEVESARELWKHYQAAGFPLSLALHSSILPAAHQQQLPKDVLASGGAILSHTATHAPNWGGSWEGALTEGAVSIHDIRHWTGISVRYAVSPFHHTPEYARRGLADAGFLGCVGGIICNDPDFVMARSGVPVGSPAGFIGHTQQCMLHGDCLLESGDDPLAVFKQAADEAFAAGTFFGFLDHPFSERYQYGWTSETQRAEAHLGLIDHMKQTAGVLFANEDQALDFLHDRAHVRISETGTGGWHLVRTGRLSQWTISVRYQGATHPIDREVTLS